MKFSSAAAALIAGGLLAGCASATIGLRSANSASIGGAPPRGAFYNSAAIQAELTPGTVVAVLLLDYFAAGIEGEYPDWRYGRGRGEPPPMAEDRTIVERDCSRPMQTPSANLRCK
jgi:hypothetical protein